MTRRTFLLACVLLCLGLLLWWRIQPRSDRIVKDQFPDAQNPAGKATVLTRGTKEDSSDSVQSTTNNASLDEQRRQQINEASNRAQDRWRTPIEFYGQVVDESSNAVSGAQVHFVWTDLSPTGNSENQTLSDNSGMFSLHGVTGLNLIVKVSKEGYYAYQPSGAAFNYAGQDQNFIPAANDPVIFRLRKKGVIEPLIKFRKSFSVPKDGTAIHVDLTTGNLSESQNTTIKVQCWTQDSRRNSGERFDWKCQVSIDGGGIQPCTEQFPFLAPTQGYVSGDEINMTEMTNQSWQQDVQRTYYIRTADGRYGRVVLRMVAHGDHFCMLESYFNPSGSRNLEFDSSNGS